MARRYRHVGYFWRDREIHGAGELDQLVYRSRLLGADLRVTNFAGGNTSAKITEKDPLTGEQVEVMWVKASGGDLGTITAKGFASLYMDRLEALKRIYRGLEFEDEMVGHLPHCTFNLNPAPASIDTPLHAFIPERHVDHLHPDAVIALATARDGRKITEDLFKGRMGWVPWQRPGFDLGLKLEQAYHAREGLEGLILAGHGSFTWGRTSKECYEASLDQIETVAAYLESRIRRRGRVFGGMRTRELSRERRQEVAAGVMPRLRGLVGGRERKVGHLDDSPPALGFVNSRHAPRLAALGTSCPDHFLRTKIRPFFAKWDPRTGDIAGLLRAIERGLPIYRRSYAAYYRRNRVKRSPPQRDANPVVFLVPGVGIITMARDKTTARVSAEYYGNAINVMRGAEACGAYAPIAEREAFGVEYWLLEEAKMKRQPPEKELSRRVAVVTGGAGGIGRAVARALLGAGAHAALLDVDGKALARAVAELKAAYGGDRVEGFRCDVTREAEVRRAFDGACVSFGGVDLVIPNAGIASSSPVEETSLAEWNRNADILGTGYFLAAREGFRVLKAQGLGGAMVFIASKNALVAGKNAAAYSAAKASELHLARCLAVEGAPSGIRVNVVNPDAVLAGSRIWNESSWRKERAATYGIRADELEEFYRQRTALKVSILPEDIAEAVLFFCSSRSAKTTGGMLNVDGGVTAAFPR